VEQAAYLCARKEKIMPRHSFSYKNTLGIGVLSLILAALVAGSCSEKPKSADLEIKPAPAPALRPESEVRLSNDPKVTEAFRDAGLGLFIHWGPNSQIGSEISWPLHNASEDYVRKYYALAETFNPEKFDPASWARLAKLARMGYVVFTTKHHDGFCMFDTALSDFKITRMPYGKDITAMVAEAFQREKIPVGFYYSPGDVRYFHETGWKSPGSVYDVDFGATAPFGPLKKSFVDYERGQIEELLTRYGDIFLLWFDGSCDPLKKYAWRIKQDVFIGRDEIKTPEQFIPGEVADIPWESCMTTSRQWSYKPNPEVVGIKEILQNLIRIRARGGNLLLNVGPRPDGVIAPPDEALLREIGLWMMSNEEGIRGVRPWIRSNEGDVWFTQRKRDGTIYAFVDLAFGFEGKGDPWPMGRALDLRTVRATPATKITILGQAGECPWTQDAGGLHVRVVGTQTIQIVKAPSTKAGSPSTWNWGTDWPVTLKITAAGPAPEAAKTQ
jgi:alpha-L-fucosidase